MNDLSFCLKQNLQLSGIGTIISHLVLIPVFGSPLHCATVSDHAIHA